MFGGHFYHQRIRRAVASFGAMFNNMNVIRKNSSGAVISQVKVPLSYAPKRDFLDRIDQMQNGEDAERQIAVKLPRMSFEIVGMNYDATRQLPKINSCAFPDSETGKKRLYTPVPYSIQFQLNVYAKSQDDALQVVEQIMPYFTPSYTITIEPLDGFDIKEDSPITMTGVTFQDDYDGTLEQRRTIIYTLDFEMKVMLYKDTGSAASVITSYDVELTDLNGNEFQSVTDSANKASPLTGSIQENGGTYTESDFSVVNVPGSTSNFYISSAPTNGTATVGFDRVLTTFNGIVVAEGSWSYTPDSDYFGLDAFTITMLAGDSATYDFDVNMTINQVV